VVGKLTMIVILQFLLMLLIALAGAIPAENMKMIENRTNEI